MAAQTQRGIGRLQWVAGLSDLRKDGSGKHCPPDSGHGRGRVHHTIPSHAGEGCLFHICDLGTDQVDAVVVSRRPSFCKQPLPLAAIGEGREEGPEIRPYKHSTDLLEETQIVT